MVDAKERVFEMSVWVRWSEDDHAFIAECVPLASISAHGETREDALREFAQALQGALEDAQLP